MVACARWSDRAWTGDAAARVAMTAAAVKMILAKDMFLFWGLLFGFVEDEKSYRSFWGVWKDAWYKGGFGKWKWGCESSWNVFGEVAKASVYIAIRRPSSLVIGLVTCCPCQRIGFWLGVEASCEWLLWLPLGVGPGLASNRRHWKYHLGPALRISGT